MVKYEVSGIHKGGVTSEKNQLKCPEIAMYNFQAADPEKVKTAINNTNWTTTSIINPAELPAQRFARLVVKVAKEAKVPRTDVSQS